MVRSTKEAAYNSPMHTGTKYLVVTVIAAALVIAQGNSSSLQLGRYGAGMRHALAVELSEGEKNFFLLREQYTKWHEGLFGSRNYHRKKLQNLLYEMLGKEIMTENDFVLVTPEGIFDKTVSCSFQWGRWLYVHGALDVESAKNIAGSDYKTLREWYRSKLLVSVAGKLKKFWLDRDALGDTVHIYLDNVRLIK